MVKVLILSLEDQSWADEMYSNFMSNLTDKATVIKATDKKAALEAIVDPSLTSILVYEPSILETKHKEFAKAICEWTKEGGVTVFGALCSSFSSPPNIESFFKNIFGLPWKSGSLP
jgi:hypothetical protein